MELQPIEHSAWLADMSCRTLLKYSPPKHSERFATYLIPGRSPYAVLGRNVESEVFGETFGDTPVTLDREYGPYDRGSLFLAVVDTEKREPAGVLRVIQADRYGALKTLADAKKLLSLTIAQVVCRYEFASPATVWDVGTLAVRRGYRKTQVASLLYALLHQQCLHRGIRDVVTVLDARVLELLLAVGVPIQPLCGSEPFAYMGSAKSVASHWRVADAGPGVLQRLGPTDATARLLACGDGLPDLVTL